jgi:hypothetical protein
MTEGERLLDQLAMAAYAAHELELGREHELREFELEWNQFPKKSLTRTRWKNVVRAIVEKVIKDPAGIECLTILPKPSAKRHQKGENKPHCLVAPFCTYEGTHCSCNCGKCR